MPCSSLNEDLKVFKMKSDSFKELHNLYLAFFILFILIVSPTTVLHFPMQLYQIIHHSPSAFTYISFCLLTQHLECFLPLLSDSPYPSPSPPIASLAHCSLPSSNHTSFCRLPQISPVTSHLPYVLPLGSVTLPLPQFFVHICCSIQTSAFGEWIRITWSSWQQF